MVAWLGRRWTAVLGLPLALFWLTLRRLPARAQRSGAPERAELLREIGAQALAWAGADLALTAALPALRLSFPPVRGAFFVLCCMRAALLPKCRTRPSARWSALCRISSSAT